MKFEILNGSEGKMRERMRERGERGGRKEGKKKDMVTYIPHYYNLSGSCQFSEAAFPFYTVLCYILEGFCSHPSECLFYSQLS